MQQNSPIVQVRRVGGQFEIVTTFDAGIVATVNPEANIVRDMDCTSVVYRGEKFAFSKKQRSVVQALFRARDDGHDFMSQDALIEVAETKQNRLRDLFRDHPAWGTLILPGHERGGPLGTYCLAD